MFSTDPEQPSPLLEFALPLGYLEEERCTRHLLTFRRDPDEMDFIVVYYEIPEGGGLFEAESDADGVFSASFHYRVGFCDRAGNLIESWDTGMPVRSSHFGPCVPVLYRTGDALYITVYARQMTDSPDDIVMQGVFDLTTRRYTDRTPSANPEE